MTTSQHVPDDYYAVMGADDTNGTVYGVGATATLALADALSACDPCAAHEPRENHDATDHFALVPCTAAAAAYVEQHGGAPSPRLTVSRTGVCLRSEEE